MSIPLPLSPPPVPGQTDKPAASADAAKKAIKPVSTLADLELNPRKKWHQRLFSLPIPRWIAGFFSFTPWVIAICILLCVLSMRFPASGVFETHSDLIGTSAFLYQFLPAERTIASDAVGEGWKGQRIIGDPVYVIARTPGPYETVEVQMEFRPIRQPLLEFGIVHDEAGTQLELLPWYSQMLEDPAWAPATSPGGKHGFVYRGIPAGRLDNTDTRGLSAWHATTVSPAISDIGMGALQTHEVSLRGSHDFWLVPVDGNIRLELEVQDVNRNRSGGLLAVHVSKDGETVKYDAVGTSGSRDNGYGNLTPVRIALDRLDPGVYRVQILSDDDVFIRRIKTSNQRWVIGPRLNIGDVVGWRNGTRSFTAWTTARHIVLETFHNEGLQTITFGPLTREIQRTHTAFRLDRSDSEQGPVQLFSPVGDVRIIGDAYFAVAPEAFFEPQPRRFTSDTDGAAEGIQAVLTDYKPAEHLPDGWLRTQGVFKVPPDADTIRFAMSAPAIVTRTGAVDIRKIILIYRRPPMTLTTWWEIFYAEARTAWHRML